MEIQRLIYRSRSVADVVSNETLRDLEQNAAKSNAERDITGLLLLSGNVFLQVLEGSPLQVTGLFGRIFQDKRHQQVELVSVEAVSQRAFSAWHMRLVDLHDLPGEKRAFMAAKYPGSEGEVAIPLDRYAAHALLLDAQHLCLSSPWKEPGQSGGNEDAV